MKLSEKIDNEYDKADALDHWCNMPRDTLLGWKNEAAQLEEENERLNKILGRVEEMAQRISRKLDAFS